MSRDSPYLKYEGLADCIPKSFPSKAMKWIYTREYGKGCFYSSG